MNITKKIWVSATKEYNKNHKRISVSGTKQQVKTRLIKSAGKRRTAYYLVKVSAGLTLAAGLVAVGYYYHHKKHKKQQKVYTPNSDEFWGSDDEDDIKFDNDPFSTPKKPKVPSREQSKKRKIINEIRDNECTNSHHLKNTTGKPKRFIWSTQFKAVVRYHTNTCKELKLKYKLIDVLNVLWDNIGAYQTIMANYSRWYLKHKKEFKDSGYFIQPLQRLSKYPLFMSELLKLDHLKGDELLKINILLDRYKKILLGEFGKKK